MPIAHLPDRALVTVCGAEAEAFLQNLITTDLDKLVAGDALPGALLSPQGKILFDFLISRRDDGFVIECRNAIADDLVRRLTMYRLRAKIEIAKLGQGLVTVSWQAESRESAGDQPALRDRRFPDHHGVKRHSGIVGGENDVAAWERLRIASGVVESGADYALGDAFPHDVLLDQNGGVGFRKGCYVGQEVISRMHHRGTARRRVLIARSAGPMPPAGTDILAGGRSIGTMGSVTGDAGIAIVRIDKVKAAMDDGTLITADGQALSLTIPEWATFTFPETSAAEEA